VVKHAVIADPELFAYLERHAGELPELTGSGLPGLVAANLDRLPVRGDPDVLYVGDRVVLPPLD
jgi:hypothetical protein